MNFQSFVREKNKTGLREFHRLFLTSANAQLFAAQKFAIEQQRMVRKFAARTGKCAESTNSRMNTTFPVRDTNP